MTSVLPKLRGDLIISRYHSRGAAPFVVKEPTSGRFFHLREAEHFIATRLDGNTALEALRHQTERQFGAALAPQTLDNFVGRLRRLGLLEQERAATPIRPGRVRGNLLYLRFPAFDPDRFFGRLVDRLRWFFTPAFVTTSAGLIALALIVSAANRAEIGRHVLRFYRFDSFLLAWLVMLAVVVLHEFAHGLTCKRFGGRVNELGFLLLFFQPTMYCNVSDAWLFPQKSHRLWVSFAGAYFEMFVWSVATLLWRVTDPHTALNYMAFIVMVTSGIKTFFNLNPLIKLDGYYLLSDYLEIPNLRYRAFSYLRAKLRSWAGLSVRGAALEASPRERRIFVIYGLVAAAFTYWLLAWMAVRFGRFLTTRYQGLGFVLFSGLMTFVFRHSLKTNLARPLALARALPGTRRTKLMAAAGLTALVLCFCRMELKVSAESKILPAHNAEVRAEIEAIIAEVFVEEGDAVAAGAPVARLSDEDYRAQFQKIEAEIAEAQASLKMLRAGPRREEVELAQREVQTAQTRAEHAAQRFASAQRMQAERLSKARTTVAKTEQQLDAARREWERVRQLDEQGAGSPKELRDAESLTSVRQKELEEAQADLSVLSADDRPEVLEATEARIAGLDAQRRHLAEQLQLLNITSPIAGVITTPKLKEKVGQLVEKGQLVASIHALNTVTVEIGVPEQEIADVHVGQPVVLKARAYPRESFAGRVTAIASTACTQDEFHAGKTILVSAQLDNPGLLLKPEMSGNAKIYCGPRRIIDLVTRRLVRYLRVEFWSWW